MQEQKYEVGQAGIKHIFFDLDHTLWDYEANSAEMLHELYERHKLHDAGVRSAEDLNRHFTNVNNELWALYDFGKIDSEEIRLRRFDKVLACFDISDEKLSKQLSIDYITECPRRSRLMPFAKEVVVYLSEKFPLTIITNGFEETQQMKLMASGIHEHFTHVVTSQKAGHKKPAREIFDHALKLNGALCNEAVMVGDNLVTDISGAAGASIRTIFFNPAKNHHTTTVDHEIHCLSDLQKLF